jgi:hypothetical protein
MIRGVTDTNRKGPQVIDNSSATAMGELEAMSALVVSDGGGALDNSTVNDYTPRVGLRIARVPSDRGT